MVFLTFAILQFYPGLFSKSNTVISEEQHCPFCTLLFMKLISKRWKVTQIYENCHVIVRQMRLHDSH